MIEYIIMYEENISQEFRLKKKKKKKRWNIKFFYLNKKIKKN